MSQGRRPCPFRSVTVRHATSKEGKVSDLALIMPYYTPANFVKLGFLQIYCLRQFHLTATVVDNSHILIKNALQHDDTQMGGCLLPYVLFDFMSLCVLISATYRQSPYHSICDT